jgi:Tfp pilus assembly protein PilN
MRAINLLPADLRGAAPAAPSSRPEPAQGIGAYVVLGALALCVALFAVYVLASNSVKQKQSDLADVTARATVASQKAAELKPYADFAALANTRVQTVRDLAAARFDWEQALRDLSRVMPADVKLQTLTGDMGLPGTTNTAGDPLRGSIQAPAVSLTGCAAGQKSVARLLSRLRGIDGVSRVSLSKSVKGTGTTGATTGPQASACPGIDPPTFSAVVFFEGSAAAAALASSGNAAVPASTVVPVPSALDKKPAGETAQQDGATATTQNGTAATPQSGDAGTTTTNTPTSTSGATAP